jgi:hypothetical protein
VRKRATRVEEARSLRGELGLVDALLERGNGAAEQRAAYAENGSLLDVARFLAEQTVAWV